MNQTRWDLDHPKLQDPKLLSGGYIEANTPCPYAAKCDVKKAGQCFHLQNFPVPYVCRLIDIRGRFRGNK